MTQKAKFWLPGRLRKKRVFIPLLGLTLFLLLAQSGLLLRWEIGLIQRYRAGISPVTRQRIVCRYEPSCSRHAIASLQTHGFWLGNLKIGGRLIMCSPLGWAIDKIGGKS